MALPLNKPALRQLADHILHSESFNMQSMSCCICGLGQKLFKADIEPPNASKAWGQELSEFLGLSDDQRRDLFVSRTPEHLIPRYSRTQAAATIENLIKTGEVSWDDT